MSTLTLKIQTPEKIVLEQQIDQALVNTAAGQMTILADHIPVTIDMEIGQILGISHGQKPLRVIVNGGTLNFENNILHILTVDAQIIENKIKDTTLFPAMLEAKNNNIEEEISKALQAGGYYEPDMSTIYLLAEERLVKYELLKELADDF